MRQLNLLPSWAVQKQRRRVLLLRLTAIQAVIFLLIILSVCLVGYSVRMSWARSASLDTILKDMQYVESDHAADDLRAAEAQLAANRDMQFILTFPRFDIKRLVAVNDLVPEGVRLTAVDMRETQIMLTVIADTLDLMEKHRAALVDSDVFLWARLGAVSRLDDGCYRYILTLF